MANVATVQEVTMTHAAGKGFEELKDREIVVPITSVRVWEKTGWSVKDKAEQKQAAAVAEGEATPVQASVEGDPSNAKASTKKS